MGCSGGVVWGRTAGRAVWVVFAVVAAAGSRRRGMESARSGTFAGGATAGAADSEYDRASRGERAGAGGVSGEGGRARGASGADQRGARAKLRGVGAAGSATGAGAASAGSGGE